MILSTLFRDRIKKYIPEDEIVNLLIGLSDISHMRPVYEMWELSRYEYSKEELEYFIEKYKYHSQHELDISYPNWDEMPGTVINMINDLAELDDNYSPKALSERQFKKYLETLSKVPKKLQGDVEQLRSFLWWREEFRDVSSRSYYLIRKLTLALGQAWQNAGIINSADDIFFLSVSEIEEKKVENACKNRDYYLSFKLCYILV